MVAVTVCGGRGPPAARLLSNETKCKSTTGSRANSMQQRCGTSTSSSFQHSQAHTTKPLAYDVLRQILDGRDAEHRRQRDESRDVGEGGYGGEGLLERNARKLPQLMIEK